MSMYNTTRQLPSLPPLTFSLDDLTFSTGFGGGFGFRFSLSIWCLLTCLNCLENSLIRCLFARCVTRYARASKQGRVDRACEQEHKVGVVCGERWVDSPWQPAHQSSSLAPTSPTAHISLGFVACTLAAYVVCRVQTQMYEQPANNHIQYTWHTAYYTQSQTHCKHTHTLHSIDGRQECWRLVQTVHTCKRQGGPCGSSTNVTLHSLHAPRLLHVG